MHWMRWGALLWTGLALGATASLGKLGAVAGPWPEEVHLLGHIVLCGGLAAAVAQGAPGSSRARAAWGLAAAWMLGIGIEGVQARFHPVWREAVFDLGVDTLGALLGLAVWGVRRQEVGQGISDGLHPLWVVPVGLLASVGPRWTLIAVVCQVPALVLWALGTWRGWWHRDVPTRGQRPALFALGALGAWVLALEAYWRHQAVESLSALCLVGALVGTAATAAGAKLSGHVGLPAALGLWAVGQGYRVGVLWLGVALVLTVARWGARRHTALEIGGAWGLAWLLSVVAWNPAAAA